MAKKITGILIKLGLDTKDVEGGLRALDKSISKSTTELRQINKALKLDPTNTELLSQKYDVLSQTLEKSRQKLKALEDMQGAMTKKLSNNAEYQKAYEPLVQELEKVTKKLLTLQNQQEKYDSQLASGEIDQKKYDKYINKLTETGKAQESLRQKIKDLENEFDKQGGHVSGEVYREYRRELEQVRAETSKLEKQTKELEGVTDNSSKAFRKAVESTKEYQQAMQKLEASAGNLKDKLGGALESIWDTAVKVGSAVSAAALAAGTAAVKVGSDFDSSMSIVQAYSKASAKDFEQLRDASKEMGATTSKTASEAADGLSFMALAGWDTEKMLKGLEPMLRASEATNADLGTTSDLVTDSMSAMGVSVDELTRYLDICAEAQSDSNTSMTQLLEAYVQAGGMLKNLNVGLDESATLLGVLANRGIKGQEAGHALNSILINLVGANKNAASAMDALGVSAYDTNGKFIGITETLRLVDKSLKNVSEQDKAIFTAKIGGKTQYDTLMALLNGVNGEYDELLEKIKNSNGALEETAKIMRDNLEGDVTMLKSALQDLGIEVNDNFNAAFRKTVQTITKEIKKLSGEMSDDELGNSIKKIGEAFAKLIEQIAKFSVNTGIPAAVKFFEFIADNGELVKRLVIGIGGAFAAWKFGSKLIDIYKSFMKFKEAAAQSEIAAKAFNNTLKANIILAVASAIWAAVNALIGFAKNADTANNRIRKYREEIKELDNDVKELSESTQKSINRSEAEISIIEDKAKRYEELREKAHRTAEEEAELKDKAIELQQYMPDSIQLIDEQTGAYNSLGNAIDGVIASMKKNAYVQAYENQITEIATAQIEAKKNLEELQKEFDEVDKRLKSKGATYDYYGQPRFVDDKENPLLGLEALNFLDLSAWNSANRGIKEAEKIIADYDKQIEELGNNIKDSYSEFNKNQVADVPADGARIAAEGMIRQYEEAYKNAEKTIAEDQANVLENLQNKMDELEKKKNLHQFANDTEYWSERRRVLAENQHEELVEWWKYYDETEAYFDSLTEAEKEAYEKQIDDQAAALKERKELNDDFTDKMYYDELEGLISTLDKESDTYKKYNSEILKGRKELADDLKKEAAEDAKAQTETQIESVRKSISEIKAEYSQMLSDVVSEREAYKNKLSGLANLYTSKEENGQKSFTLENIDEQIKAIEEYDNKLAKLEARGAGKGLISYIQGLSDEDADNMMHILENKTNEQLKSYSEKYDKLTKTINDRMAARYDPQIEAINQAFTDRIKAEFGNLSKDMEDVGKNAIDGFIKGFTDDPEELIEAVEKKCNAVLDGFKNGLDIHSPSKKTEEVGEYTAEGFENGLKSISGADAAETFADDFIKKMAEKDSQLHDVLYNAFTGNTADAISEMNSKAQKALSSIPKLNLPVIPTINIPEGTKIPFGKQTDNRIIDGLNDILNTLGIMISLIQKLADRPIVFTAYLTNEEKLILDGKQIADVVTKRQYQERKMHSS